MGLTSPEWAVAGLGLAFAASVVAAVAFHRWVEQPAAALDKMAEAGVKDGIVAGVKAAEARGRELGKLLGAA